MLQLPSPCMLSLSAIILSAITVGHHSVCHHSASHHCLPSSCLPSVTIAIFLSTITLLPFPVRPSSCLTSLCQLYLFRLPVWHHSVSYNCYIFLSDITSSAITVCLHSKRHHCLPSSCRLSLRQLSLSANFRSAITVRFYHCVNKICRRHISRHCHVWYLFFFCVLFVIIQ